MTTHHYSMADAPPLSERERLRILSEIHDPQTVRLLDRIGVPAGARCLEVGPGDGSIARVLAGLAGPTGQVVAADVAEGLMVEMPDNVEFRICDVRTDDLDGPYDIVHVRHVLLHIPQRDQILDRLAASLRPGGALFVEEYLFPWEGDGEATVGTGDQSGATAYVELMKGFLDAAGADYLWAQRLPLRLRERGLVDVTAEGWFAPTTSDHDAVLPIREGLIAASPKLKAAGLLTVDDDTVAKGIAFASNPEAMFLPYLLVSAWGRAR